MNVLLSCAAGMTTSLLAEKIQETARSQGKDYTVWAVDDGEIPNEVANKDIAIVLLGPQIRYKLSAIKKKVAQYGVPVELINSVDFGMSNAENIIRFIKQKTKGN